MRKIELQMNDAITNAKNWCGANTQVCWDGAAQVAEVFLHGNLIAKIGEGWIQLFDGNHQSNTTKSRLNAILSEHGVDGEHVFQKNHNWFVRTVQGVQPSDPSGFVTVPFFSGMRLN
jgi:hypothetical protein